MNLTSVSREFGHAHIVLKMGDITKENVDVIVNAANVALLGGGGVDGAIHKAGGPKILAACQEIRRQQTARGEPVGCPVGKAVITEAGNLKAKYVVHTVGPDLRLDPPRPDVFLRQAYESSLALAAQHNAKTISFPSISTGVYSFPIQAAATIALKAVADSFKHNSSIKEVRFVLFSQQDFEAYRNILLNM